MREIGSVVVEFLGVVAFGSMALASNAAQREARTAALAHFTDFSYRADVFGLRRAGSRMLNFSEMEQSRRLIKFLTSAALWPCFVRLDLSTAPVQALCDPSVQQAFFKMPRLERLILPETGWSTPQERLKVIRELPTVAVVPERRSFRQGASPKVVVLSNVAAPSIDDVPPGHAAHYMVSGPRGAHPCYAFRFNGTHYQTTVGRAGGSHENAARIARLLYARVAAGARWQEAMAYREELYSICASPDEVNNV